MDGCWKSLLFLFILYSFLRGLSRSRLGCRTAPIGCRTTPLWCRSTPARCRTAPIGCRTAPRLTTGDLSREQGQAVETPSDTHIHRPILSHADQSSIQGFGSGSVGCRTVDAQRPSESGPASSPASPRIDPRRPAEGVTIDEPHQILRAPSPAGGSTQGLEDGVRNFGIAHC